MKHFLRHEWQALLVVFLLALGMQGFEYYGWLAGPEGRLLDTLLGGGKTENSASNPILLLEIDDDAYLHCFKETSPMDPRGVQTLVAAVAERTKPWVIGVDILTDSEIHKEEYRAMEAAFRKVRPKVVWIAGAVESKYEPASFWSWLAGGHDELIVKPGPVLGYTPGELAEHQKIEWGLPVYPRDEDAGLRRFPREIEMSSDPEHSVLRATRPTWARMVAEEYCHSGAKCEDESAEEVLVSYAAPAPKHIAVEKLFACPGKLEAKPPGDSEWKTFADEAQGKIVLIGGTFRQSGDFHETPIGRQAGLSINAYSVQAEIDHLGIHETRRPVALLFDLAIGVLIVLLTPWREAIIQRLPEANPWRRRLEEYGIRWIMAGSGVLVALAAALTWVLFGHGYLLSFLGVGLGVVLHQVVEVWMANPKLRD